jgi:hypothetical protein
MSSTFRLPQVFPSPTAMNRIQRNFYQTARGPVLRSAREGQSAMPAALTTCLKVRIQAPTRDKIMARCGRVSFHRLGQELSAVQSTAVDAPE